MLRKITLTATLILSIAIISVSKVDARRGRNTLNRFNDETKAAIQERVTELREAGASREEIRVAIAELFEGFGIEAPEKPNRSGRAKLPGSGRLQLSLTDEQRTAIREKIEEMREAGASRKEIRAAAAGLFEEFGVNLSEKPNGFGRTGLPGASRLKLSLTDEQRTAIGEKVDALREAGASREEIRTAVAEMLKGFGVQAPENPFLGEGSGRRDRPGRGRIGGHRKGFFLELTDEQHAAIHKTVTDMKDAGANRKEIRAAIVELLKEYGVIVGSRKDGDTSAPGEADGATADLAIVDGGIAAAPEVSSDPELKMTTWGYLKAKR